MKIQNRLTWNISLIAVGAIATLGMLVYILTARFHAKEFFSRLEERVAITELIFLENNEMIEQAVRDKFLQRLDEEKEYAITLDSSGLDSMNVLFPHGFQDQIQENELVRFWQGHRQGVGKTYHLPSGEYAVVVTAVDTFGKSKLNFLKNILFLGGLAAVVMLVVVSRLGIRQALKPLENKINRARIISADRLDLRLEVKTPDDEIGELAIAFNRMLDRLQAAFEAQTHFVSNASHEIRNPLTAIIGETEVLLEKDRKPEEYKASLQVVQKEAERLELLTRQLLQLAKTEAITELPDVQTFSLDTCLLETIETFPANRLHLHINDGEEAFQVQGNPELMRTALSNLISNALKYSGEKKVTISLLKDGKELEVWIEDQGIGIPEKDLLNILQPLFRSHNARRLSGHGIGLPLSKKIIELHQGTLTIHSEENVGTIASVRIPAT